MINCYKMRSMRTIESSTVSMVDQAAPVAMNSRALEIVRRGCRLALRCRNGASVGHSMLAVIALWTAASHAATSATEAPRYVNAQGIEIIHNRAAMPSASESISVPAARVSRSSILVSQPQREQRAMVSAKEQGDRDKDRAAILQQELGSETTRYQGVLNALSQPNVKERIGDAEWQRLQFARGLHEENIKALNAEIGRVRPARR